MKPIPEKHEEKEILFGCSFMQAQAIGNKLKKKYPQYDFWAQPNGVFVGAGLSDKFYGILYGYAECLFDTLAFLRGDE